MQKALQGTVIGILAGLLLFVAIVLAVGEAVRYEPSIGSGSTVVMGHPTPDPP